MFLFCIDVEKNITRPTVMMAPKRWLTGFKIVLLTRKCYTMLAWILLILLRFQWGWLNTLDKTSPLKNMGHPEYDTKLQLMVQLQFWRSGEYEELHHYHYSQVVVSVRILTLSQIDLF